MTTFFQVLLLSLLGSYFFTCLFILFISHHSAHTLWVNSSILKWFQPPSSRSYFLISTVDLAPEPQNHVATVLGSHKPYALQPFQSQISKTKRIIIPWPPGPTTTKLGPSPSFYLSLWYHHPFRYST